MKTSHSEGTVLITGASKGIGLEFAKLFAKKNYDLVLVSHDKEELVQVSQNLQTLGEVFIKIIAKDLSESNAAQDIFDELQKDSIEIDILINNAGFANKNKFSEMPYEAVTGQIGVNVFALTSLTRLLLPTMLKQQSGKILNVASTAAFLPGPKMSVYHATKAYVLSFSEAIATELQRTGVTITILCPGPTKTNFEKRAGMKFASPTMSAEKVAQIGFEGLMAKKLIVFTGKRGYFGSLFFRLMPHSVSFFLLKLVYR